MDNQRSAFLKRCRARLQPSDVGLPAAQRTRTTGLRREDVAAISGVSASWYTWLEQGRPMRVSDDVLDRVCETLRLNEDERTYLYSMVQNRSPRASTKMLPEAPAEVVRMINALNVPAIARNLRWDVLAWNEQNSALYRDYSLLPPDQRNLLEILLTRPVKHMTPAQLEITAQRLIARLRYDYSQCMGDPKIEALVQRLNVQSPLFNRIWRTPDFTLRGFGLHRFTHARFGQMTFEHASLVPDGYPNLRIVISTPESAAACAALAQVNAELAAGAGKAPAKRKQA
jgi:transcriptional regulator with XRE-family HTH domain